MYGDSQYGVNAYGLNPQTNQNVKENEVDLDYYVPPFIYKKKKLDFNEVQTQYIAQSNQISLLKDKIEDLIKQGFIDTATWGLSMWEDEYGLDANESLPYEERREIIKAKKRGRGTTTIEMIKNTAESFSNAECEIIPHNDKYYFTVHFIGVKGIPRNMEAFKQMLEIIKPAHLNYDFTFTYNTYGDIKDNGWTYSKLQNYTHDAIRTTDDIKKGANWNATNS